MFKHLQLCADWLVHKHMSYNLREVHILRYLILMCNFLTLGFYQMCLTNAHNSFGSMQVFLNFGVYYKGAGDTTKTEDGRGNITDTLSQIEVALQIPVYFGYFNA